MLVRKKLKKCLTGQIINGYEIGIYKGHIAKAAYYECKCANCGVIGNKRISAIKVQKGRCKICGPPKGKEHPCWKGCGDISHEAFTSIKHSAIERKLEFDITIEYIWRLYLKQNKKCALTGWDIVFPIQYSNHNGTASLDRIDPKKGYIKKNVQWVHRDINKFKLHYTEDELFTFCKAISQYRNL